MTEAQLIHEGWTLWTVDPWWLGAQWSHEEKQRMSDRKPLTVNKMQAFRLTAGGIT